MLKARGDWMPLGGGDEQKPASEGSVEAWGRSPDNPVGGWYGLKNGLRGRFGVYLPPLLEALGLAELTHDARNRCGPSEPRRRVAVPAALARSGRSRHHGFMAGSLRPHRPVARLVAALALAVASFASSASIAPGPVDALSTWSGGISLYRDGVFTTQKTWLWCTAADVQIARNIVRRQADHSRSSQARYFDWMRARNRYDLPLSAGVDPQGWTAGMRHFVDDRYRLVASRSFDGALKLAVKRMRLTNLPVALAVSHGNHGWLLTGFTATADPARTDRFSVTSVRVVGPLYGLQSRNGYDMKPNTKLTVRQLRTYFTPWHYDPKPMVWDGTYVSIQPVPRAGAAAKPAATPAPKPKATPAATPVPTPAPTLIPTPLADREVAMAVPPEAFVAAPSRGAATTPKPAPAQDTSQPTAAHDADPAGSIVLALASVVALAASILVVGYVRTRPPPRR
jgi:hypothetical protein